MRSGRSEHGESLAPDSSQTTLTDGRLAVLLTEYAELGERMIAGERADEGDKPGTPSRSYSLAHYESRQAEDLEGRRAEILRALKDEGMPTDHWIGYGDRAALLTESPPGYPDRLQLYDCLWRSLQLASEQDTALQIVRSSRKLEYRNSLSGPRRALMEIYENASRNDSVPAMAGSLVVLVAGIICALLGYLFSVSAGVLVALVLCSGFSGVAAGKLADRTYREQLAAMEAELVRRERGRIPEPAEKVYVRGLPAEVEYPEPGEHSPIGDGLLDVRFAADGLAEGRRARVALGDVRPAVNADAATVSDADRAHEMTDRISRIERGEVGAPWTRR